MRLLSSKKTYLSVRPTLIQGEPFRLAVGVFVLVPLTEERAGVFDQQELAQTFIDGAAFVDEGFAKTAGEFLVAGDVFANEATPRPVVKARARVGRVDKSIVAIGDRRWSASGVASKPEPFASMPLDWSRAFGGPRNKQNPLGLGAQPNEDGVHPLPNLELPSALIASPSDKPTPAGFGPIDMMWSPRHEQLGTYDEAWLADGFPGYARDLDRTYFNVAPPDQRLPHGTFWSGDETITLEHLHASRAEITAKLPGLRPRVFIHQRAREAPYVFAEVDTRLETIVLLPNTERAILMFRGEVLVREDDGDDVLRMLLALEGIEDARPVEHYKKAFLRRLDRKRKTRVDEGDLRPRWTDRERAEQSDYEELVKKDDLVYANMKRGLEGTFEIARAKIKEQGLDPDVVLPMPVVDPGASIGKTAEDPPARAEPSDDEGEVDEDVVIGDASAEVAALKAMIADHTAKALASAKETCAQHGVDLDGVMAKGKEGGGGPPKFKAESIRDHLREVATLCTNAGVSDDENLGLGMLADGGFDARMQAVERLLLDGYRAFAHLFPAADLLAHDASTSLRRRVEEGRAAGASFAGWDFTGADLSGVDLNGADLRGALLEKVDLRRAQLRGTLFDGAVLTRADLTGADTSGATFSAANLGEARLGGLRLAGADLRGCVLVKADLHGADLTGANLSRARLVDAVLSNANLTNARAIDARLTGVQLDGARLTGSDFSKATFQGVNLSNLDFSGANLERAEFIDCDGVRASFAGAHMHNARFAKAAKQGWFEGASFAGADLSRASLGGLQIAGADFTDANLDTANLSGVTADGAKFVRAMARDSIWIRASLKGADLSNANLLGATMKNADLCHASLRHANLFNANLYRVRVDGKTDIKDAELATAMFVEYRA